MFIFLVSISKKSLISYNSGVDFPERLCCRLLLQRIVIVRGKENAQKWKWEELRIEINICINYNHYQ